MSTVLEKTYSPGDKVEASGIYKIVHDRHTQEHEVTCVYGEPFPPCRGCGRAARFKAVRLAQHISSNDHFKP